MLLSKFVSILMSITIKEIAKLAGVSRGTVDRVLNNRGRVAVEVKEKILRIADQYGYRKNVIASQLAKKESKYIGVVLPDPQNDPYWKLPLDGVMSAEKTLGDYGIKLVQYPFDVFDIESYRTALGAAIREKVDAIMLAPTFAKEASKYISITDQNDIPVVLIDSEIEGRVPLSYIGQDCIQSGRVAGRLLCDEKITDGVVYVVTLGKDSLSGSHTMHKINGLTEYISSNGLQNKLIHTVIDDIEDHQSIISLGKEISNNEKTVGLFFTNSRAYHFFEHTNVDFNDAQVRVVAYDLLDHNIQLLKENRIDYILNQNPHKQAYYAMLNLFEYFVHNKVPKQQEYLAIDIIIKENYKYYLSDQDRIIGIT